MPTPQKSAPSPVRTVSLMIGATAVAKALGMVRMMCFARFYGDGEAAAAFSTALDLPLTFFDLLLGAAIAGCFIPAYNSFFKGLGSGEGEKADAFASVFLNTILLLTGAMTLAGMVFTDAIVALAAPGFDAGTAALAAGMYFESLRQGEV